MMNFFLALLLAASLPTYEDFRRVDRVRRLTGQLQTAELLAVTRIDPALMAGTVHQHTNDVEILWGAAELTSDWTQRRAFFEAALAANSTNKSVALRFAAAAALNRDFATAEKLLPGCQKDDSSNIAPWMIRLWILRQQKKEAGELPLPPLWATRFNSYLPDAARARIRTLEAAGYSPYSSRRLGFMPETFVLNIARDLAQPPIAKETSPLLLTAARAMQQRAPYLITELVGQTLERAVLTVGVEGQSGAEASMRDIEVERRREELKALLTDVERNTVDLATETEMVRYFDNVLALGEEIAMKRLAEAVRGNSGGN